ncbi:hypothetical protein L1276_003562 [Flavobacterium sp. HSC-32F16]|uniref:hypothetical protein n=1 Tax=Flavobacterium sp. HSC-32F16 TaxID=2910964 RepID=UPI0020A24A16|nr:hypothetical protein [Flavobacterium sp. HSC-32F16]MCP2028392.1 hypothetical protein [Flavobacterium sp. HSC-32F16]
MRKILYFIFFVLLFVNCNNADNRSLAKNTRTDLVPEPDKEERLKYEALLKLKKSNCILDEPDISVNGIDIRDSESAKMIIGEKDKINESGEYYLYSNLERETLTLIQHPGDAKYQISIFKVETSSKLSYNYRQIKEANFKTGKGIKLGMNKNDIIQKLGKCYAAIDSTKGYMELYYRIELPNDTKAKLLKNSGMPVYYASYKLWNDKLEKFEFGFEYP